MSENALYLPLLLIGLHSACGTPTAEKKAAAVMQPAPAPGQQMPTMSANAYVRKSGGVAK